MSQVRYWLLGPEAGEKVRMRIFMHSMKSDQLSCMSDCFDSRTISTIYDLEGCRATTGCQRFQSSGLWYAATFFAYKAELTRLSRLVWQRLL